MKTIITIIVLLLIAWGGYALMNRGTDPSTSSGQATDETAGGTQLDEREVKTFTVTGKPFSFTPSTIEVNEGDSVRIVFKNEQGTHDWVIDEFDARTEVLTAGQEETIDFRATKKGTFEYYCSVGTHRQQGMVGTLIVN